MEAAAAPSISKPEPAHEVSIRRAEAVVNEASGSVGAGAAAELEAIVAEFGIELRVHAVQPSEIVQAVHAAVDAKPDLIIVLAGDGTARLVASLCGEDGPIVAPLPGGTMNMLPKAVYGTTDWRQALRSVLDDGREQPIGGGVIEDKTFLVAAILGPPALWAPAREAVREGRISVAMRRARRAWRQAFSGRLRYSLDGGARGKAEALSFLCPLASAVMSDDEQALEAAIFDVRGAADVFRMGVHAVIDNWRSAPAVQSVPAQSAKAWSAGRIPALLDGEPTRLPSMTEITWRPHVARILAPPPEEPKEPAG
jgi:diacylglycerol kinase family enzyme